MKTVGILVFDGVDLLDVTCPVEVLGTKTDGSGNARQIKTVLISTKLASKTITAAPKFTFEADHTLAEKLEHNLDAVLVPGGPGLNPLLGGDDAPRVWAWLRAQADKPEMTWVCSVCAGALLLGVAGLLTSYSATTHWAALPVLRLVPGVHLAPGYPRVVVSGNRITSGGVTSALDLALVLKAALLDEQAARNTELMLQYDPQPPFGVGRPDTADATTMLQTARLLDRMTRERADLIKPA